MPLRYLLACLLLPTLLTAQRYTFGPDREVIFPLPAALASRITAPGFDGGDLPPLRPLPPGTLPDTLPTGHYLHARISKAAVHYRYHPVNPYRADVRRYRGRFQLRLYDETGRLIPDAEVTADGRPVRYRSQDSAYQRRDWRIDELRVRVGTDTLLYHINETINFSRLGYVWRQVTARQPLRTALAPLAWVVDNGRYLWHGVRRRYWGYYPYPFRNRINRIIRPPAVAGYAATDKPQYRPGDTIELTAYLTMPRGRPLRADSVELRLEARRNYGRSRQLVRRNIGRSEPGRYTTKLVVGDDWPLDHAYTGYFYLNGLRWREIDPEIKFRVADYELDEYELTVSLDQSERSTYLDLRAEDVNGQPLPSGELTVTATSERIVEVPDTLAVNSLPDTLWTHRLPTDGRREHRLVVPDTLVPAGWRVGVTATVRLLPPSGETQEQRTDFTLGRGAVLTPLLEADSDRLRLGFVAMDRSVLGADAGAGQSPVEAELLRIAPGGDTATLTVTLPTSVGLDHRYRFYLLRIGDRFQLYPLDGLLPTRGNPLRWRGDTAQVSFPNPHRQPLRWRLFVGNEPVGGGTESSPDALVTGLTPGAPVHLRYHFLSGGYWRDEIVSDEVPDPELLTNHEKVLDLTLDVPVSVRPGERVNVGVRATDQRGRPAAGVRLTAGSYNTRFDAAPVTDPTYRERTRRRRNRQDYALYDGSFSDTEPPPAWVLEATGKDRLPVYRLLTPDPEYQHYRSLDSLLPPGQTDAHLVPYLRNDYQFERILSVFVDSKLAYAYHRSDQTPYTIPVDSGRHRVTLQTARRRYSKALHLRPRHQLLVSLDIRRTGSAGWTVEEISTQDEAATERLSRGLFALRNPAPPGRYFYRQLPGGMLRAAEVDQRGGLHPLGPATPGRYLELWTPAPDSFRLAFEPGFSYRLSPDRERLYELTDAQMREVLRTVPYHALDDLTIGTPRFDPAWVSQHYRQHAARRGIEPLPHPAVTAPTGRLQVIDRLDELTQLFLRPLVADSFTVYSFDRAKPVPLRAGRYELVRQTAGGRLQRAPFRVVANRLRVLRPDRLPFTDWVVPAGREDIGAAIRRSRPPAPPPVDVSTLRFGGRTIRGVVTDASGEILIGASILLEGTTYGTVTDIDGRYRLAVPEGNYRIVVSYTGFESLRLDLPGGVVGELPLTLNESTAMMDQIVVTGYSTTRKRSVTAAIQVRGLAGAAAGVQIRDGINIRGSRASATDYRVDGKRQGYTTAAGLKRTTRPLAFSPRARFADRAAFVPHLVTDARGRASFPVIFPDDITAWTTYAVGQDRRRRVGYTLGQTRSFLPLQAQLYVPRFLVAGDSATLTGLAINRTDTTRAVRLRFGAADQPDRTVDTLLREGLELPFGIRIPSAGADSVAYRFSLTTQDQAEDADGEERAVRVYPRGARLASGTRVSLDDLPFAVPDSLRRPERGPTYVRLLGSGADQLTGDLDYLLDYPYDCTEQAASRLLGLLAYARIERARTGRDRRGRAIQQTLRLLGKRQRDDGGFALWPGSIASSSWVSRHAYRALTAAERAGYAVPADLNELHRYLRSVAPALPAAERYATALLFAESAQPVFATEAGAVAAGEDDLIFLTRQRLAQLRGDTVRIDSLLARAVPLLNGGLGWSVNRTAVAYPEPLSPTVAATLLAYRILRTAGHPAAAEALTYLLGQSGAGDTPRLGRNTLESALLVAELLPDLLTAGELRAPTVRVTTNGRRTPLDDLPRLLTLSPDDAVRTTLVAAGSGPLRAAVWQEYFVTEPQGRTEPLTVTTQLTDGRGRPVDRLRKGQKAYVEARVTSAGVADYVLLEVPLPAGCSFADRNEARGAHAVHRTYARDRVAIFVDRLPPGTHTYRVALEPRFTGRYYRNPARVSLQYQPAVLGLGQGVIVPID